MQSHLPTYILRLLVLGAMCTALTTPTVRAADTSPVVAKSKTGAPVTITDDGTMFILDNGIVTAHIAKRNGSLEQVIYKGVDRAGHDQGAVGVWEQDPSAAAASGGLTQSITIDPAKNGGERGEVSIKGVTGGKVMLTPNAPGGGTMCDLELRYAMGRGDSGIYTYAIFSHPKSYGAMGVGESRFILRVNQSFDWISVDADRNLLAAGPLNWGTGVVVHAKEQRIMSQGPYKNSVEHKYSYNAIQYRIPAYGWSSTQEHVGVWFINPTIEYLSGGASKQELVCHYGDNDNPDPILLNYWRGTHYGGGATCTVAADEEWSKVVGPMFVYVNSLDRFKTPSPADLATFAATAGNPTVPPAWTDNATALWKDALGQAKSETAKWPYDWVAGVDYPHKAGRATVGGQLVLNDPLAPVPLKKFTTLTIGLAYPDTVVARVNASATPAPQGATDGAPAAGSPPPGTPAAGGPPRGGFGGRGFGGPRTIDWAHDAKHYQFWNDGAADGKFTITNVRPGTYTLHAFADGVLGEFAQANITVEAGKNLDLGKIEWKPVRYGKQLWEIGVPNRNSSEFFKGDRDNYWLWGWPLRYALLFPNDLTYTVGQSDWHKDWFFEQVPHAENLSFINPEAKDPANQKFGWVKAESRTEFATTDRDAGVWRKYGRGRATTWTIKFNVSQPTQGTATLRIALAGADGQGLSVVVNGKEAGSIRPVGTNALRYNTDKGIWQEQLVKFDGALLKAGDNEIQLVVPAGEVTSGVVYDYLRLELDENAKLAAAPAAAPTT
jgi:rhamnogalacturonan endolyase